MQMQHVVKINGKVHEIKKSSDLALIIGSGKGFAIADMQRRTMIHKHATNGRFMAVKIK